MKIEFKKIKKSKKKETNLINPTSYNIFYKKYNI